MVGHDHDDGLVHPPGGRDGLQDLADLGVVGLQARPVARRQDAVLVTAGVAGGEVDQEQARVVAHQDQLGGVRDQAIQGDLLGLRQLVELPDRHAGGEQLLAELGRDPSLEGRHGVDLGDLEVEGVRPVGLGPRQRRGGAARRLRHVEDGRDIDGVRLGPLPRVDHLAGAAVEPVVADHPVPDRQRAGDDRGVRRPRDAWQDGAGGAVHAPAREAAQVGQPQPRFIEVPGLHPIEADEHYARAGRRARRPFAAGRPCPARQEQADQRGQ